MLSDVNAIILLLSAALGSGFLCLPYVLALYPIQSNNSTISIHFYSFLHRAVQLYLWDLLLLLNYLGL
jgi:hypothetical protein